MFGSMAAFFAIGIIWNLFGHDIDRRNPATWVLFGCLPLGFFGFGWAVNLRTGLKLGAGMLILLVWAAMTGANR
jgi:hypothetical protein